MGLKDNAFEASSPLRHMAEFNQILTSCSDDNPLLLLYTDDGPDHRLTYVSVKLSLIALLLCAVRTPPHHSWKKSCGENHVNNKLSTTECVNDER